MKEDVVKMKSELSEHQMTVLNSEMEKHKKSPGLAYVFWFFLGTLGIHKFYIGKTIFGIIYLLLGTGAWISLGVGIASETDVGLGGGIIIFIILISILGLLLLIDVFTISRQIRKVYEKKEVKIIQRLASLTETS